MLEWIIKIITHFFPLRSKTGQGEKNVQPFYPNTRRNFVWSSKCRAVFFLIVETCTSQFPFICLEHLINRQHENYCLSLYSYFCQSLQKCNNVCINTMKRNAADKNSKKSLLKNSVIGFMCQSVKRDQKYFISFTECHHITVIVVLCLSF